MVPRDLQIIITHDLKSSHEKHKADLVRSDLLARGFAIHEYIGHTHRIGTRHVVILVRGEQFALASMLTLGKTLNRHSPLI